MASECPLLAQSGHC